MDSVTFDEFYRFTSRRLLQYTYAMCGDLQMAQDLVQEAYVKAWQRWRDVGRYDQPESWLRLVVTRMITDRWRRLGARRRAESRTLPPEPVPPPSVDGVMLATALRTLPAAERRAVVLHYLLDMPIADIAAETDAPIGTVKSWLSRGRDHLADALAPPHDLRASTNGTLTTTRRTVDDVR